LGGKFVSWYYKKGPIGARFIEKHNRTKSLVRIFLCPLVTLAWLSVKETFWSGLILLICIIALGKLTLTRRSNKLPQP